VTTRELTVTWKLQATVEDDRELGMVMALAMKALGDQQVKVAPGSSEEVEVEFNGQRTTVTVSHSFVNVYRDGEKAVGVEASDDVVEEARREHLAGAPAGEAVH